MLRSRILTALGLALLLVIAIMYSPPKVTAAILSLILLIGAWEWSGFLAVSPLWRVLYVVLLIGGGLAGFFWTLDARCFLWTMTVAVVWWLLALLWIVGAPLRGGSYSAALAGVLALLPAWIALVHIDAIWPQGAQWTLFILALSFAADTGAFFAGRQFGRLPLAPRVSPKKTWEGVLGGMVLALGVGTFGAVWFGLPPLRFVPLCLGAAAFSVVGDLTESLLKRHVNLKDSGRLFPGHGGVLDRIDSVSAATPVITLGLIWLGVGSMSQIGVVILGSTGTVGVNTLEVLALHPERFRVFALAARSNVELMLAQCRRFEPEWAALESPQAAQALEQQLRQAGSRTRVVAGAQAIAELPTQTGADYVMAAISGAAGLASSLAAAGAGKRLMLANKESAVMAGALLIAAVQRSGAELIPIDSEHNAIFQCLPAGFRAGTMPAGVRRLLLTASGGPFLNWSAEAVANATPAQACAHPRWNMGRKISVDSATLMNKGLELIEASVLFGMSARDIDIVVHPQSVVHSLVEYQDGSMLAQLSSPDMRVPIAHALAWPHRMTAGTSFLDLVQSARLDFLAPDPVRFPCLRHAQEAARLGGLTCASLNAADEIAVQAFLDKQLNFGDIPAVIECVMGRVQGGAMTGLEAVLAADGEARALASELVARRTATSRVSP